MPGRRGNGASVARIVPYAAIHFTCYERFRAALTAARSGAAPSQRPPVVLDLLAGSASGAVAVGATYPLDLVRTRLAWNAEAAAAAGAPVATIGTTLRGIVAKDGVLGLYRVRPSPPVLPACLANSVKSATSTKSVGAPVKLGER